LNPHGTGEVMKKERRGRLGALLIYFPIVMLIAIALLTTLAVAVLGLDFHVSSKPRFLHVGLDHRSFVVRVYCGRTLAEKDHKATTFLKQGSR
jgi:uncharacterized RDD family membrane protein YckC